MTATDVTATDVVICEPLRTPVGRFGGVFRSVPASDLAATVIRALLDRTGVPGDAVDDVLLGHCNPSGEAPAIGRVAALDAGLPVTATGLQVDRRCGSGLQAVISAVRIRSILRRRGRHPVDRGDDRFRRHAEGSLRGVEAVEGRLERLIFVTRNDRKRV